jgi:DNA-binding CsgD family transcriptional regulator
VEPHTALLRLLLARGAWAEAQWLAAEHPGDVWLLAATAGRYQGETATAWTAIERYLPAGPATAPGSHNLLAALECQQLAAALALDAADLPAAHAWLDAHDRWLAWSGAVLGQAERHLGWAAYHRAAGDLALAHEHAARALAHASKPRQPLALLAAHRWCGELATAAGQYVEATAYLTDALALADACAAPYERALCLLAQSELHAATGQPAEAQALLDEARTILEPLAARPALARADTLLARLALLQPPRPRYPAGLTAREVAILRLLAAGQSNRAIAAVLSLSPHTVERHLANLYGKIDAHGRADATAFAFRHHLT